MKKKYIKPTIEIHDIGTSYSVLAAYSAKVNNTEGTYDSDGSHNVINARENDFLDDEEEY